MRRTFLTVVAGFAVLWLSSELGNAAGYKNGYATAVAVERPAGWVCGAREKMDGSEYRLYLCDAGAQLSGVVAVGKSAYDEYTNPMGQDWKGER